MPRATGSTHADTAYTCNAFSAKTSPYLLDCGGGEHGRVRHPLPVRREDKVADVLGLPSLLRQAVEVLAGVALPGQRVRGRLVENVVADEHAEAHTKAAVVWA